MNGGEPNKTLARVIEEYTNERFKGKRANKRPDLFLAQAAWGGFLLVEFKRPRDAVGRDAESQAKKYRDDLTPKFGRRIDVIVVGGEVDSGMATFYEESHLKFLSYNAVIGDARCMLQWLLKELTGSSVAADVA